MTKYLMIFAALFALVACGDDTNKTSVDEQPIPDETVDTEQPDETVDTEQPDSPTDDILPDEAAHPDDTTDTETPDVDNGTGTPGDMVDVPAGEFWMGCNEAVDNQCEEDEYPYHAVSLLAYKIGKYEVTVAEYQQCVTNGACNNNNENEPHYRTNTDASYCNLGAEGKDNHPMQCVSWFGAKAYCEWIGGRLPTEAEWEKAARGTDGRKHPWGNAPTVSCDYAVIDDASAGGEGCGSGGTMPVGSKPNGVSPYGAYDMIGNVREWVNDWYASDYYENLPTNNPIGPETGDYRVSRGGSWYKLRADSPHRASYRFSPLPPLSYIINLFGFRCAMDDDDNDPVDNEPVQDDATVDNAQPDIDTEQPDIDTTPVWVTDQTYAGLEWSSLSENKMKWQEAIDYCKAIGARLPNISELRKILINCPNTEYGGACQVSDPDCLTSICWSVDCNCDGSAASYSALGEGKSIVLFSSSSHPSYTNNAWCVYFGNGGISYDNKYYDFHTRCVR